MKLRRAGAPHEGGGVLWADAPAGKNLDPPVRPLHEASDRVGPFGRGRPSAARQQAAKPEVDQLLQRVERLGKQIEGPVEGRLAAKADESRVPGRDPLSVQDSEDQALRSLFEESLAVAHHRVELPFGIVESSGARSQHGDDGESAAGDHRLDGSDGRRQAAEREGGDEFEAIGSRLLGGEGVFKGLSDDLQGHDLLCRATIEAVPYGPASLCRAFEVPPPVSYGLFGEDDLVRAGEIPSIVLRDYQRKALAAVLAAKDRGLNRVMVVMATGCGKTTVFASLIDEFERSYGAPSLVLAHRQELLVQAASRVAAFAPRLQVGIEGGNQSAPSECQVVVAGVQSVGRPDTKRLDWFHPGLMIVDEGHHTPADTYQIAMRRFGSYDGSCFTLGVTATDHRMDNKPLHGGAGAIFEDVVFRFGLRDAVREGWLVDLRGYRVATDVDLSSIKSVGGDYNQGQLARAVNTEERNYTAYRHWREVAGDRRTIVFCVDVQHAKDVAELFRSHHVAAEHVDGTLKSEVREGILRRFSSGKTQVLVNVDIATEGFDAPATDCVLLLRPTQSWALYCQMVGRGLRTLGGTVEGIESAAERRAAIAGAAKGDCIVIDVVDASKEFGLSAPPEKAEEDKEKPKKGENASLAGLVGLPPEFDLQGNSLFAAAERVEELEPARRGALFRRQTSWDDLSTVLSEVDLIKELSIPEEIVGVSGLAWMKIGDGEYWLPCGESSLEKNRAATIRMDELGRMAVELRSSMMPPMTVPLGDDLQKAFDEADRLVRMTWADAGRIVKADARWREKPPSERQKEILKGLGVSESEIAVLETMHQARSLIERRRIGIRSRMR